MVCSLVVCSKTWFVQRFTGSLFKDRGSLVVCSKTWFVQRFTGSLFKDMVCSEVHW